MDNENIKVEDFLKKQKEITFWITDKHEQRKVAIYLVSICFSQMTGCYIGDTYGIKNISLKNNKIIRITSPMNVNKIKKSDINYISENDNNNETINEICCHANRSGARNIYRFNSDTFESFIDSITKNKRKVF